MENPPVTGGSPHKGLVTRKMFPFKAADDDAGNLQPVFFKAVSAAYLHFFIFSFN